MVKRGVCVCAVVIGVKCKIGREEIVSGGENKRRRSKFHYALELKLPKRKRAKLAGAK
jgi:hypothetical protein